MYDEEQESTQKVNGAVLFDANADVFNFSEYAGEISIHYWTPDKSNRPDKKVKLEIRDQALKSADIRSITKTTGEIGQASQRMTYLQQQLERCKPPREIDRKQERLDKIKNSDYEDDPDPEVEGYKTAADKAEDARLKLETEITKLNDSYKADYAKIEKEIQRLLDLPSIYEVFRRELFVKVIDDHNFGYQATPGAAVLTKLDFSKEAKEGEEPPLALMRGLYEFLLEVINSEKKAKRK